MEDEEVDNANETLTANEEEETEMEEELESDYISIPCEKEVGTKPSSKLDPKELLHQFKYNGKSLYEHLVRIMEYIISTRPGNTIDYFDQLSRAFRAPKDPVDVSNYLDRALKQTRMYSILSSGGAKFGNMTDEGEAEEEEEVPLNKTVTYFLDAADYFQEMDVGLPKHLIYQIDASIKHLALREGIQKARFWGMIFGTKRSYIVAECELTHSEIEHRLRVERGPADEGDEEQEEEEEDQSIPVQPSFFGFSSFFMNDSEEMESPYRKLAGYRLPLLPMPVRKQKVKMKKEDLGEGANKKVYYVCHEPGDEWIELPDVEPEQIIIARQIRKYFQGNLTAEVVCYPPFPGKEREYLRAQIARISAGTHISPIGYYQFGSSEEMEGEGETDIVINLDYEIVPYQDMLSTAFWVHHVPHILRIGRTTFYEPLQRHGEEIEDEEREEKEGSVSKEMGPPLLTPLSEDVNLFRVNPWTIKGASKLIPGSGAIGVTSNLWPGAYCVCRGRYFENVYLGYGLKYTDGYSPLRPPFPEKEYEVGPEICEINDPTPEEEENWRKAHEPPLLPHYPGEGEGEEELGPIYPEPDSELS